MRQHAVRVAGPDRIIFLRDKFKPGEKWDAVVSLAQGTGHMAEGIIFGLDEEGGVYGRHGILVSEVQVVYAIPQRSGNRSQYRYS